MSEDIDIALAPEAFQQQYKLSPSGSYVKQLKKIGTAYTSQVIAEELLGQLQKMGVPTELFSISVELIQPSMPDKDPQVIFVHYVSLLGENIYLADYIKLEFGVRSLKEPFDEVAILSAIGKYVQTTAYNEHPFIVQAVVPEKTMIEKLLLLHEKFSREGVEKIIIAERQSRHLVDIVRLKQQNVHHRILSDAGLFQTLVKHRQYYIRLRGIDYEKMTLRTLQFVPPLSIREQFREDYEIMKAEMIYGDTPDFDTIIVELQELSELLTKSPIRRRS